MIGVLDITASAVKSPEDGRGLSIGARSGLTGLVPRLAEHLAHRFGLPEELGNTCAYLCSAHAGYINGQNLLMDGGSFPGVF